MELVILRSRYSPDIREPNDHGQKLAEISGGVEAISLAVVLSQIRLI
jgi:hypothetical protein